MRIAATKGLGEALVQGEVVGSDVVVRGDTVEGDLADLPAADALAVARVARDIEALHGRPQDIEWAIADGSLHVLQARPITVVPVRPSLPRGNNWQKDLAHYPEPLTPFGWSVMQASADDVRAVFDETGLLVRGLEEVFVGGEIYGRVLPAFGSADSAGNPPPAVVMGVAARVVPELRRRNATARRVVEDGLRQRWLDEWFETDRAEMQRRAAELRAVDVTTLDDAGLADHHDTCVRLLRRGIQIHFRLMMPLFEAWFRLHQVVGDELGWDDAAIASMLAGHSPATRTAEDDMAGLRRRIRGAEGAVAALEDDPRHPVQALARIDADLAARAAGVDRRARLGAGELRRRGPGAGRAAHHRDPPDPGRLPRRARRRRRGRRQGPGGDAARDAGRVRRGARAPLGPSTRCVRTTRSSWAIDRWRCCAAGCSRWPAGWPSGTSSRRRPTRPTCTWTSCAPRCVGDDTDGLTDRILRRRGEEAWVRANPGPAYVGEQAPPPDISRLPEPLRLVNEPVMWGISHEYPAPVEAPADADVLLAGVAASPGLAEGPVRVIRGHHDMDRLCDGDVLVCHVTSPAWAPMFSLAAAVVADGGGVLSHAAIASREHGLPAVLGTGDGTDTLRDGQRVRVDGARGLVFAVD